MSRPACLHFERRRVLRKWAGNTRAAPFRSHRAARDVWTRIMSFNFRVVLALLLSVATASATAISGRVTNQTRGIPAAGDDVILLRLGEGMQEVERTRTDKQGAFSFAADASNADYIVRVMHQGVNYDQKLGGPSVPLALAVYDAVAKVPGLAGTMGIAQVESDAGNLKVTEMYSISNGSNPPVTQTNEHNFAISLPANARLDSFQVKRAGGVWVNAMPSPVQGMKGHYAADFPLRPGDTLFKFVYHLPVQSHTALKVTLAYPVRTFGVVHPPSISFTSLRSRAFTSPGMIKGLQLEQLVSTEMIRDVPVFELSGVGTAPSPAQLAQATAPQSQAIAQSPDAAVAVQDVPVAPLIDRKGRESWAILVATALLLLAAVALLVRRKRRSSSPEYPTSARDENEAIASFKDELSQLETEKLYGAISPEEYEGAKQALNVNLQRAMARNED
jgi:hypothetical protein